MVAFSIFNLHAHVDKVGRYDLLSHDFIILSKGSLGATLKLLLCDLVTDSNRENSLLQYRAKLHTKDPFPRPHINGSFVHRTVLFFIL